MTEAKTSKPDGDAEATPRIDAAETFNLEARFKDLGLSDEVLKAITARGFEHPMRAG